MSSIITETPAHFQYFQTDRKLKLTVKHQPEQEKQFFIIW